MSLLPYSADTILAARSGKEVPHDTMVKPITASDTPRLEATNEALSTNMLEPAMRHNRPTTSITTALSIDVPDACDASEAEVSDEDASGAEVSDEDASDDEA